MQLTDILNGTASGLVLNSDGTPEANGDPSYNGLQAARQNGTLSTAMILSISTMGYEAHEDADVSGAIHDAIPSEATYFVYFAANAALAPESRSLAI